MSESQEESITTVRKELEELRQSLRQHHDRSKAEQESKCPCEDKCEQLDQSIDRVEVKLTQTAGTSRLRDDNTCY